ncbi:uncharacterized protein LOC132935472 [Metopolophium dirhodum]|uniref:uncharacterized protein LOC132935472 n=1 Tax=Metopolophium dirhodum TaxID=44670 RepID=UPI00298FDEBD|nr:uncharacterized protein LOC132935472 [Metopolophium dirhodum]
MNNHESDQDNNKKQEPQIGIELYGSVIKIPLSTFNNIIECVVTKYILGIQNNKKDIIGLNDLVNNQPWKKKYNDCKTRATNLNFIEKQLERDLKINMFAQPMRCLSGSVKQYVKITPIIKAKMARDAFKNSKKKYQICTISDSEDDCIITDTSNIKSIQTKNDNIIDFIDLDNDTQNLEVKYKPAPKSKTNCKSYSEDDGIVTDTSNIKSIQTKNDNIIDLIDLDDDTQNLEVKYKPAPKSKTNCKSYSEDDCIITDTSNIKSIQTKNDNIIDLIDLDDDTQNLEVKYKPAPKSKTNCKSYSEDDCIITDMSNIKSIQTKNDNIIDLIDLDNDTQNLEVKNKPAPKSKTNVSIPDLKSNDNNKVLPINTEAGKTLSNGEFLSTTIHKRKPEPKSKTMFVSDMMVPFNAENEEIPGKKMRLYEYKVINNKESNTINCNSVKKLEVPENYNYNLKSSNLKWIPPPPPYLLIPQHSNNSSWKNVPPIPNMTIKVSGNKVTLTWDLNLTCETAQIKMYELFVYQEKDSPPNISTWKKKGNINAELLPMCCELEVFDLGYIYHFALRAVDIHNRCAPFAVQKTKI